MNPDQNFKRMLRKRAEGVAATPVIPEATIRRVRARKALMIGGMTVAVAGVAVAGVFMRSTIWSDAAPVPPAEERNQEIEQMRNGRIVHSEANFLWQGDAPVPRPGAKPYYAWDAFDQETGSFLYVEDTERLLHVVDQDGLVAEVPCDTATTIANELVTWATSCGDSPMGPGVRFGPGPDEVSVLSNDLIDTAVEDSGPRFVQIMAFDGTVRDKIDVSSVVPQGQRLKDFAWSPDGSHLAISTHPGYDCDPTTSRCEANVWVMNRTGGEQQLVFTELTSEDLVDGKYINHSQLEQLAWSPDGRTLSLLDQPSFQEDGDFVWPRLVALRLEPDQPVRAETLYLYDGTEEWERRLTRHRFIYFMAEDGVAYAWSPDGTRIAVNSPSTVAEISADDGTVLTRHSAEEFPLAQDLDEQSFLGPLAWLPKQ